MTGVKTPVGILPAKEELNTDGLDIDPADLDTLLTIDTDPLEAGDRLPPGAPRAVRQPPRGDLGRPPPRRRALGD